MSRYTPIEYQRHAHSGWLPYPDYHFATGDALAPVSAEEMPHVMASLPLAFSRTPKERFQLVALQSLSANTNLCINAEGHWLTSYVPACYRSYPFRMLPAKDARWVLCADAQSGLWLEDATEEGERCFTDKGDLTPQLEKIRNFLEQMVRGHNHTAKTVGTLERFDLIQPWPLKTQGEDGTSRPVKGLYRIDEQALNALAADQLAELRSQGGLSIAYAQLLSQHRLPSLASLYRLRHDSTAGAPDLEKLLGDDDDLIFDFDS